MPLHSAQCVHGSEKAVSVVLALAFADNAYACEGRPNARAARQPKRPARRRSLTIDNCNMGQYPGKCQSRRCHMPAMAAQTAKDGSQ